MSPKPSKAHRTHFLLHKEVRFIRCQCPSLNILTPSFTLCPSTQSARGGEFCGIHWQHLCREVRYPPTSVLLYDTKQSDGEVPVMPEYWGMRSTPSLPSLPVPLWTGAVAPDRVLSMTQKELNCVLILKWITWNRTVLTFKQRTYAKLNYLK